MAEAVVTPTAQPFDCARCGQTKTARRSYIVRAVGRVCNGCHGWLVRNGGA